jgi:SET domain-containing protein
MSNYGAFLNDSAKVNVILENFFIVQEDGSSCFDVRIVALEDIDRGDQLYLDYGRDYWIVRKLQKTKRQRFFEENSSSSSSC